MSENKAVKEKRKEFTKRISDIFEEIRESGDREFSVLLIATAETTISDEHGIANALIASWGRRDLIGVCLCNLMDEDYFYKRVVFNKVIDEIIPELESKFVGEKH